MRNAGESSGCLRVLLLCSFMVSGSKRFYSVEAVEGCDELKHESPENSFTIRYLMKSCGLSQESAKSITRYIHFNSSGKPDSIIEMLKGHGFSGRQITKVVKSCPQILLANIDGVLLSKLEFFSSIGFSDAERAKLISSCPRILIHSLHNSLIPSYNSVKSMLTSDETLRCLKRSSRLFLVDVKKYLALKVSILNSHGVPQEQIRKLVKLAPRIVCSAAGKFDEIAKRVIDLGIDVTKPNFIHAVAVMYQLQESTWEQKIKVYKSCGWSEDDIFQAFRISPFSMAYSEEKIRRTMDFYVKIGLQPSLLAKNPMMMGLSLEKRIKPRCLVIIALMSRGVLMETSFSYVYILRMGEKQFIDRFVIKYCKDVPQLLSIFRGKSLL